MLRNPASEASSEFNEDPGDERSADTTTVASQPIGSCETHLLLLLEHEPISAITLTAVHTTEEHVGKTHTEQKLCHDSAGGASAHILRFDWLTGLSVISSGLNRQTADVIFKCE